MLPNWLYGKSKSKLQEILGGGGIPADYDQVKAQVNQNTEDIALLNTSSQALTSAFVNNVNVNGSKNRFIFGMEDIIQNNTGGTWSGNTFTKNGATFTIDDGSIIFGGMPTTYVNFKFILKISKPAIYELSGLKDCVNVLFGGCTLYLNDSQVDNIVINSKNDTTLDLSAYTFDTISIDIKRANDNVAMSGTAFIMLCLKSDWDLDQTYVPPTMTNQELTEKLTADANLGTAVDLSTYAAYSNMYTAPSDGYVHFQSAASGSSARTIYAYGNSTTAATDSHFTHSTSANNKAFEIFIKKGLKIYADGLQTGDTIYFYPLT